MSYKIKIRNLAKDFGSKSILKNVNLKVQKGQSLVILGGSGSGKSVLIKTIATLLNPTSGSIKIDNKEVTSFNTSQKNKLMEKFGFLFQGGALFDSLKIWENVAFRLINQKKIDKKDAKEIAIAKLKSVGLDGRLPIYILMNYLEVCKNAHPLQEQLQ